MYEERRRPRALWRTKVALLKKERDSELNFWVDKTNRERKKTKIYDRTSAKSVNKYPKFLCERNLRDGDLKWLLQALLEGSQSSAPDFVHCNHLLNSNYLRTFTYNGFDQKSITMQPSTWVIITLEYIFGITRRSGQTSGGYP